MISSKARTPNVTIELLKLISTQKAHKTCYKQGLILHYLGTNKVVGALVVWKVVWASLISPTKIRVLTSPWIIRFGVWGIEGLPLVVKSISLLYLDCSLDLRKVRAVNSRVGGVIANDAWLLHSRSHRH